MVDDVLRMRTTIVNEEALANIRAIGREIGLLPQKARPAVRELNTGFAQLGETIKKVGSEIRVAAPGLTGFGLGAAGVGLAVKALVGTMSDMANKIVELKYASKELGLSEREIRSWTAAAEKVGVSSETMMSGLKGFTQTMNELKYNTGAARDELIAMGAGPIVQRMRQATTQAERLKIAFDFKEVLEKADPTGFKARRFFEQTRLGADAARLTLEQYNREMAKRKPLSPEEIANAEKFKTALIDLDTAWTSLGKKAGTALFPILTQDAKDLEAIIKLLETLGGWIKKIWGEKGSILPPEQQRGPRGLAEEFALGYRPMAYHPDGGGPFGPRGGAVSGGFRSADGYTVMPNGQAPQGSTLDRPGAGPRGGQGGPSAAPDRGRPSALNDEAGKPIDQKTAQDIQALGEKGDVTGMQSLLAQRGYIAKGPFCGMLASRFAKGAGFKPPEGGAVATNWRKWGESATPEDINAPDRPFGSMVAVSEGRTYGGRVGAPLATGETGGHVEQVVPGSYDPKTKSAVIVDQSGARRRPLSGYQLRYAGATAVAAAEAARKGGAPAAVANGQAPQGSSVEPSADVMPELSKFVRGKESFSSKAFSDYGQINIGYGTSARGRTSISEEEARKETEGELATSLKKIDAMNPNLSRGQRIALASLDYNLGWTGRAGPKYDALRAAVKAGDTATARKLMLSMTHAGGKELPGLVTRRKEEASYFDQPDKPASTARIDRSVSPTVNGSVNLNVESNGTAAKVGSTTAGRLFSKTTIRQSKQMQPTSSPAASIDYETPSASL